jgi:hypothetical protein
MCVMSVMIESAKEQWPPVRQWPYQQAVDMAEILKRLDGLDKKLGVKDCFDPTKDEFIQKLKERIESLEKLAAGGV